MIRAIAILLVCVPGLYGQPAAAPRFEVASVKLSNPNESQGSSGVTSKPGRLQASNVTLKRCIVSAYGMGPNLIFGGPEWLDSTRFEITAKAETPGAGDGELMGMLRTLLADRFKLSVHRETRTLPAYVLEVGKNGPKLKKSEGGEGKTISSHDSNGMATLDAAASTMDHFAEVLSRQMDLPVVNHTGLEGAFDLKLTWSPIGSRPAASDGGPTIFTAIQELGLRLQSQKAPLDVLVIDHAEKPTAN